MNLAYKYPIIYWDTACLIANTGGDDTLEEGDKTNDYAKIARAIGKIKDFGAQLALPDIN